MNIADVQAENKRLQAENQQLQREKAALEKRVAQLEAEMQTLKETLETTRRQGKRQATPFSKGEPKAAPKKPGQKPGHSPSHRPVPTHVDRMEDVILPAACPDCGGAVKEDAVQAQYQIDIPRPIPVIVTQFNIHVGHCTACGRRLQGRHADQTSDATGAAAVQIGPNALGLAAELKHEIGVPYGKTAKILSTATELIIQRSTLARASQRLAKKCQPTYAQLIVRLRHGQVVHVDETGWKIGGHSAWLWVFTNEDLSLYVIDPSRAHEVVEEILGRDYAGILVSDCFAAYDPLTYQQSKCVAHLLRHCKELQELKSDRAVAFSQTLAELLRKAVALKKRRSELSEHGYAVACGQLEAALDRLLAQPEPDEDNARFVRTLVKQRARLLTFLYHEAVDPTNNAAEQELRPAVVVRKTGGCNRTDAGAEAHAILASVLRTCLKQGFDPVEVLKHLLHSTESLILDLATPAKTGELLPPAVAPP
jgi:transposase